MKSSENFHLKNNVMEQNNNVGLYRYKQNNIQYFDHLQKKKKRTCSIKKKIKKVLGKKKHKRVQVTQTLRWML